jgi:hypothetical protein
LRGGKSNKRNVCTRPSTAVAHEPAALITAQNLQRFAIEVAALAIELAESIGAGARGSARVSSRHAAQDLRWYLRLVEGLDNRSAGPSRQPHD